MKVTVLYFASLRERAGRPASEELIGSGTTAGALWEALRARKEFQDVVSRPGIAVNGEWSGSERVLADGDEVGLLPPVSGG